MFFNKVETVGSVKDFLGGSPLRLPSPNAATKRAHKTALTFGGIGVGVGLINQIHIPQSVPAMAMPVLGLSVTDKIIQACQPIIQLIQGVSYPVGFIMICAGFLVIMTGNRQKGLNIIKWAAIGYIGMQFAPAIMTILVEVGRAMGK